jgi:hypothetical protein
LGRVLGRKPFYVFGTVTFLTAALLAAVNITSRRALKLYVEDQLARTPWDLAVYNTEGFSSGEDLPQRIQATDGVQRVETIAFLRAMLPEEQRVMMTVDGEPLKTPWLCMLGATDLTLLPPALRLALASNNGSPPSQDGSSAPGEGAILALIGPESAIGAAFTALQGAHEFDFSVQVAAIS